MNSDMFVGRLNTDGSFDTNFGTYNETSGACQGYFAQDLGSASSNSADVGKGIATDNDGPVMVIGNTSGGNVAVAQYFEDDLINVSPAAVSVATPNTVSTLGPIADAYTRSSPYDSTNYGSADDLQVDDSSAGDNRETYITFDLSSIVGNILDVQLRLYGGLAEASNVYTAADVVPITAPWNEGTITADNAPADAGSAIASTIINSNVAQWYTWDLSGYIENQLSAGVTQISIGIEGDARTDGPQSEFNSREASSDMPQLVVTTDVATFSPTADSFIQNGSYADTNFGTSSELDATQNSTTGDNRVIFLTFDTSSDTNSIATAVVALYGSVQGSDDTNVSVTAYPVSDTSWSQNSITWNNAPTIDTATPLSTAVVTNSTTALYTWDITSYLLQQRALGINTVSVALVCATDMTDYLSFASTNSSGNAPMLWTTASSMPVQYRVTATEADLTWEPVIGASSYSIYRSDTSGEIGDFLAGGMTVTSYSDTTLSSGQTAYYTIIASNGAGGILVLPPNDWTGTDAGGGGGAGGGPQIQILTPDDNDELILGSAFAQPNFEGVSSGGEYVSGNNIVAGRVGVSQFNPNWGTLVSTQTDLTYNYEWNCDGTGYWGSGADMYYAPIPTAKTPDPTWKLVVTDGAGGPPDSSDTVRGEGDAGHPSLTKRGPGFGMEMVQVISKAYAACCGLTADTPCDATVSGMWTGYYSVIYDYIPTH